MRSEILNVQSFSFVLSSFFFVVVVVVGICKFRSNTHRASEKMKGEKKEEEKLKNIKEDKWLKLSIK